MQSARRRRRRLAHFCTRTPLGAGKLASLLGGTPACFSLIHLTLPPRRFSPAASLFGECVQIAVMDAAVAAAGEAALRGVSDDKLLASVEKVQALMADAQAANKRARYGRAFELYERALAVAEAELAPDSIVLVCVLQQLVTTRIAHAVMTAPGARDTSTAGSPFSCTVQAAWRDDPQILALAHRTLALLHVRWRDGTLDKLRIDEMAALYHTPLGPQAGCGLYIHAASDAFNCPPLVTRAAREERAWFVCGALRTTLTLDERGLLRDDADTRWPDAAAPAGTPPPLPLTLRSLAEITLLRSICILLQGALQPELLTQLRATCGLSRDEEAALRRLTQRQQIRLEQREEAGNAGPAATFGALAATLDSVQAKGERAIARHGLRACALPQCERVEPEPKAFKLCSRCQHVVYCCKEHQTADWRRHKREDCTRPAA